LIFRDKSFSIKNSNSTYDHYTFFRKSMYALRSFLHYHLYRVHYDNCNGGYKHYYWNNSRDLGDSRELLLSF